MKNSKFLLKSALIFALSGLLFASCQKEKDGPAESTNDPSSITTHSNDVMLVNGIANQVMESVGGILYLKSIHDHHIPHADRPCDGILDSTRVVNDTVIYYASFDGVLCEGDMHRTGRIEIRKRVGSDFGDKGDGLNLRFYDFMTKTGGRVVEINGMATLTNVAGGYIHQIGQSDNKTLVYRMHGVLDINMDENQSMRWHIAQQTTITGVMGSLILKMDGFGSEGDHDHLVLWGEKHNGHDFYTSIPNSIVFVQDCYWLPVAGQEENHVPGLNESSTVTFGFNKDHEMTTSECPTFYRLEWRKGDYSGTEYLPLDQKVFTFFY